MFSRPGITVLRDQAITDMLVSTGLPTLLRRSPLRAMAYAQAGLAYGQYGYLDWIARQATPFTATGVFLEAWAALVNVARKAASPAVGTASFIGTVGAVIPIYTVLRRYDGVSYLTMAALTLTGNGTGTVAIQAQSPGSAYTLDADAPLLIASPVPGVQSSATGQSTTPGTDPELDAPFRTRMLLRWSAPPQGGDQEDYVLWALAVPGVSRAWCKPLGMGPGTVLVYHMWDVAEAAHGGFPQGTNGLAAADPRDITATGDQLTVANAVFQVEPVTPRVYSMAPAPLPVPFNITTPVAVSALAQANVSTALDAVFLASADPVGGTLSIGPFDAAIAASLGTAAFTLTAPAAPITGLLGQLPVRGPITWTVG